MVLPGEINVNRQSMIMRVLAGLALLVVVLFLAWCPPDVCRVLNIHTYTISRLDEYRQFLADEAAFHALHRVRAARGDCSALRDDVVTALKTGQLALGTSRPNGGEGKSGQVGPVHAWHQGRLLHLTNATSGNHQESEAWVVTVRESVTEQQRHELSFLPRLFGGVILHVQNKQIPIVLFSDQPCV